MAFPVESHTCMLDAAAAAATARAERASKHTDFQVKALVLVLLLGYQVLSVVVARGQREAEDREAGGVRPTAPRNFILYYIRSSI